MKSKRSRFSILKENRVATLQEAGYSFTDIAPIVNGSEGGTRKAFKRYHQRWKFPEDKYCGRKCGFLDDAQISQIRYRYESGESVMSIATDIKVTYSIIYGIITGRTYVYQEEDGFPFDFSFRPNRRIL